MCIVILHENTASHSKLLLPRWLSLNCFCFDFQLFKLLQDSKIQPKRKCWWTYHVAHRYNSKLYHSATFTWIKMLPCAICLNDSEMPGRVLGFSRRPAISPHFERSITGCKNANSSLFIYNLIATFEVLGLRLWWGDLRLFRLKLRILPCICLYHYFHAVCSPHCSCAGWTYAWKACQFNRYLYLSSSYHWHIMYIYCCTRIYYSLRTYK